MVPSYFQFLDAFPYQANGKVDRQKLPEIQFHRPDLGTAYLAPRSELEEKIAQIWKNVLGIDEVGINDNFFDLGGHSLLVSRVLNQLRMVVAQEISVVNLFQYPTIASLSQFLTQKNITQHKEEADQWIAKLKAGRARLRRNQRR